MSDMVKVRAIKMGIHNHARVREGGEFWVERSKLKKSNGEPVSWYRPVEELEEEKKRADSTPPDDAVEDLI